MFFDTTIYRDDHLEMSASEKMTASVNINCQRPPKMMVCVNCDFKRR